MSDIPALQALRRLLAYVLGLWRQPHWWAETWSGAVMVSWALFTLFGKHLNERPAYAEMTHIAPAIAWEWLALTAGMFQLTALVFDSRWCRAGGAFFCSWFFGIVLVSFIRDDNFPPAMALYGGYAGINVMALYKLLRGKA